MGQHIASTMAQLVAEELEASWKDMNVVLASNDPKYNDPVLGAQVTGGSWSTGMNFDAMCRAGAAGRLALIKAASEMMGVPEAELHARESRVHHAKSKKSVTFAEIVKSGKANKTWSPDELKAITLKTPDQYTKIGQSLPQIDIPSKTNGTCKYGIDAFVPGMLYGKPVIPPVRYGATVKSVDDSAAKKVPGFVKAVVVDDKTGTTTGWVVAVASSYEGAKKAAAALKVDWDKGPNANVSGQSIIDESRRLQKDGTEGFLFVKDGDSAARNAEGRQDHRGRISDQHQYPCAAGADERAGLSRRTASGTSIPATNSTRARRRSPPRWPVSIPRTSSSISIIWAAASDAGWNST